MPTRRIENPYNFEKCRWCNHYFLAHTSILKNDKACEWMDSVEQLIKCNCKDFAPKANLEYLEYLYDKQH